MDDNQQAATQAPDIGERVAHIESRLSFTDRTLPECAAIRTDRY